MTKTTTDADDETATDEQVPEMTPTRTDDDHDVFDAEESVVEDAAASAETAEHDVPAADGDTSEPKPPLRQMQWSRIVAYGLLPALALVLTLGAGFLKWKDTTNRDAHNARVESVQTARDSTVALLSYTPADVEKQLVGARDLLTGDFKNSYTSLTNDVVIPGARQQQITAVATVPAASSVSATVDHAVALVFVNQTTTVGTGAPTNLASAVRVTMDKLDGRWLISSFDPV